MGVNCHDDINLEDEKRGVVNFWPYKRIMSFGKLIITCSVKRDGINIDTKS